MSCSPHLQGVLLKLGGSITTGSWPDPADCPSCTPANFGGVYIDGAGELWFKRHDGSAERLSGAEAGSATAAQTWKVSLAQNTVKIMTLAYPNAICWIAPRNWGTHRVNGAMIFVRAAGNNGGPWCNAIVHGTALLSTTTGALTGTTGGNDQVTVSVDGHSKLYIENRNNYNVGMLVHARSMD